MKKEEKKRRTFLNQKLSSVMTPSEKVVLSPSL